ncbi:putative nucleotidyltransferase substrate binding domain-containing protein [Humidesulfovibrio idahonensis]
MTDALQILPDPFLRMRAGDIACPAPVFVRPDDSVTSAAARMAEARATAALVREQEHGPVSGILTERDVLARVVAAGRDAGSLTVGEVMTPGLIAVHPDELLIEAFSLMVRHGVRRLALLDASGRPVGLLGEGDILAARGESPLALAGEIAAATNAAALARVFARLARLAARCVAEGLGSEPVGRLISEMHDRIMSRAWALALTKTAETHGPAPAPHAVLVLGSQARREQYLATDQDLALVYASAPGAEVWFAHLGEELTAMLLETGFPPCPKRIMLNNPAWRRSVQGWLDLAQALADDPGQNASPDRAEGQPAAPEATNPVVLASLLVDMRPLPAPLPISLAVPPPAPLAGQRAGAQPESQTEALAGRTGPGFAEQGLVEAGPADPGLGRGLRAAMTARLSGSALLLKLMAMEAVRFAPPLGLFRGFSLKKDAEGRGSLNVKRGGVFPITQGVKVLALEHHLPETGTLSRLRALKGLGVFEQPLADGLCEALSLLQTLRMRAQAEALVLGAAPDNELRPDTLGALEREGLRGAFKLVAELQDLLSAKYALHLLG